MTNTLLLLALCLGAAALAISINNSIALGYLTLGKRTYDLKKDAAYPTLEKNTPYTVTIAQKKWYCERATYNGQEIHVCKSTQGYYQDSVPLTEESLRSYLSPRS